MFVNGCSESTTTPNTKAGITMIVTKKGVMNFKRNRGEYDNECCVNPNCVRWVANEPYTPILQGRKRVCPDCGGEYN